MRKDYNEGVISKEKGAPGAFENEYGSSGADEGEKYKFERVVEEVRDDIRGTIRFRRVLVRKVPVKLKFTKRSSPTRNLVPWLSYIEIMKDGKR